MSTRRDTWRPPAVLAAAVLVPALVALLSGLVTVQTCLPASGGWAQAGLRLALLRPDEACPHGTLAVGTAGQALTVVVAAARRLVRGVVPGPVAHPTPQARLAVVAQVPLPVRRFQVYRPHRRGPPAAPAAGG